MSRNRIRSTAGVAAVAVWALAASGGSVESLAAGPGEFFAAHCRDCHDADSRSGGLDLVALGDAPSKPGDLAAWVKIYDRVESGEMPPKERPRPPLADRESALRSLGAELMRIERAARGAEPRRGVRRMTRAEYENTMRDLFDLPGVALQSDLPPDGSAHGFDKNSDALDISHVNLAKYVEAADRVLEMAVAGQPVAPQVKKQRISLANPHGFVAHVLLHGDGVLLKNKRPDPEFPPTGDHIHLDQGAHERLGSFHNGASVGLFRHEDESFHPYFNEFVAIYPARYRLTTSLWSFQWDKGQVLPARGVEAVRLSIVQLTGDGRGGGHPSTVLGYYAAPSIDERKHETITWLNEKETIGFNAASLVSGHTRGKGGLMKFSGPGVVCDYLDVEGPLYDSWPPLGHRRLFGDLPIVEFKPAEHPNVRPPKREPPRQKMFMGRNTADPVSGIWTVHSDRPLVDADRLLAAFLPRAFRRPVEDEVRRAYVELVDRRLQAGDCFETAMRRAYRSALCSPDFLYHVEASVENAPAASPGAASPGDRRSQDDAGGASPIDDYSLACRLSYLLWNSAPDDRLYGLAAERKLRAPETLRSEVERLLGDPKAQRFVDDFLGQWLKLRSIAANDPDKKLYPEFTPYLQDSMVAETRAYFRELIDKNLDVRHFVQSDFAMLNEKLAVHYGVPGVTGPEIRRTPLPPGSPRGGFLTQASILKITANGTTTSPVPRGAFVMDRLLGRPPEPPPPNVAAVEPDVRGATTIREQLAKHRDHAACASCHAQIDPPGFALESFDVIGGFRSRYRSIGAGDPAPRGAIDPLIGIQFKLGPPVDSAGVLPDGRSFQTIQEFQTLIAGRRRELLDNFARRLLVYSTGRPVEFGDRDELRRLTAEVERQGGGVRTLLHELVQSSLFQSR